MGRERFITSFHMEPEGDVTTRRGHVMIANLPEVTGNQRKQIGRLGEWVFPDRHMARGIISQGFRTDGIAVGQQHRIALAVRLDAHTEAAQHVGAVGVKGDPPESLGLALRREHPTTHVQPFQGGVGLGVEATDCGEFERLRGWVPNHQPVTRQCIGALRERLVVDGNRHELEINTAKLHGCGRHGIHRFHLKRSRYGHERIAHDHIQVDGRNPERIRPVVTQTNCGLGCGGGDHEQLMLL